MVVAMMSPDSSNKGGRGNRLAAEQFPMVTKPSLSQARKVHSLAKDLIPNVLSGAISLDKAYQEARNREQLAQSDEVKLAELQKEDRKLPTSSPRDR
jgi:hypothetical protein